MKQIISLLLLGSFCWHLLYSQPKAIIPTAISPNTSVQVLQNQAPNAITIIIDVSGSMRGQPLAVAKRSSLVLIDLIELWSSIYPNAIGNMQVQFILFGAGEEVKVLQPLTNLRGTDFEDLKARIWADGTQFGGTDYSLGIEEAVRQLSLQSLNNKTLFLTDAGDGGAGPNASVDYALLGDTKFILYGQEGDIGTWLQTLPEAEALRVNSEFEVTTTFVATLFEFVDDINKYLVRRGKSWTGNRQPFFFEKHSPSVAHDLIITRPDPSITLEEIRDKAGNPLAASDYMIYHQAATFYQVRLEPNVPKGVYQLIFASEKERSQAVRYISFERSNIQLKSFTSPNQATCFIENENINFKFEFWDEDLAIPVKYSDFLPYVAYGYQINQLGIEQYGKDLKELHFTKNFPLGSAGAYDIQTSWNYNLGKLRKGDPPLKNTSQFCVEEDGRLVHLTFDTSQTWEGRPLDLSASIDKIDSVFLKTVTSLFINTGKEIIELRQTKPLSNLYIGQITTLLPDWYQLSIENRVERYKLGFSEKSITQFEGRQRFFQITTKTRIYEKLEAELSFWKKWQLAFSSLTGKVHFYTKTLHFNQPEMVTIPYELPFYEALADDMPIQITLNKQFPDEQLSLDLMVQNGVYAYEHIQSNGWWGAFQQTFSEEEALTATFSQQGKKSDIKSTFSQYLAIHKLEGDMDFQDPLQPPPSMTITGALTVKLADHHRQLVLRPQEVRVDLVTSYWSQFWTQTIRNARWVGFLSLVIGTFLAIFFYALYRRTRLMRKLQKWEHDCKHQSPEDFYALYPSKLKQYIGQLVQQNANNPTLFPTNLAESQTAKEKRMLRYQIRQQAQHSFDKKLVSYCSLDFLNTLADRLRQRHLDNVQWNFALTDQRPRTVRIVPFEPDLQQNREDYIRVRVTAETNYGEFEVRDGQLYFYNRYNIVYVQHTSSGHFEWKDIGSKTTISTGQVIHFGPDRTFPYFKAIVFFNPERLSVTISSV